MSQQDTGLDPANGDDPSVAEPSDAGGDVIQVPQKSAEEEAAEAEAAAAERARQMLEQQIAAVDDAEEVCVFLVEDTLTAMFQEMQVLAGNASVFTHTSAWASDSVFAGVQMGGTRASTSLDRSDIVEGCTSNGDRQQILKLDEDGYDDAAGTAQDRAVKRRGSRSETTSSSLRFLRRLLAFIESSSDQVGRELMTFPAAQFVHRGIPSRSASLTVNTSNRVTGDWEIPSGSIGVFLTHMIHRCHVRVLPSTVRAVLEANAAAIDAKGRVKATLSLNQITHFVRKALLAAEQGEDATQEHQLLQQAGDTEADWSQRTFPTEVAGRFNSRRPSDQESLHTSLQCCFMEEGLPVASGIDRNVPGSIARKIPDQSPRLKGAGQKQLARRVIMAMMPGPKESSRWLGLRTRVIHDSDPNIVQVAVDADMEVSIDSKSRVGSTVAGTTTKPTLSPKKPSVQFSAAAMAAASPTASVRASKLAGRSFSTVSNTMDERTIGSPITISTTEPDTAALSNIFSLGTPRQLNGDELARRNDILAQLEREEMQQQRRLANASIAAMTFPPSVCPSDAEERAFRAYVTANSSITTGVDFDFELPLASLANGGESSPPLAAPRRPEKKNTNQSPIRRDRRASGATGGRSKFEVACDPPAFAVHDGNAHDNVLKEAGVPYSPIRKGSPSKHAGPPSPPTALGGASLGNGDLSPIQPVQSAGHHLPQLDTSRLAVGVRAVVRGVEKRGPRQNPSRQSRLKLHNYNAGANNDEGDSKNETYAATPPPHRELQQQQHPRASVPGSPIRSLTMLGEPSPPPSHAATSSGSTFLPLIPPVSPITANASPLRSKHVAFANADDSASKKKKRSEEDGAPLSPSKISEPRSAKRAYQKQLVFDKKTVSPPRVRNRHFTGRSKKMRADHSSDYEGDSDDDDVNDLTGDRSTARSGGANIFAQPLEAPRRNLLPSHGN